MIQEDPRVFQDVQRLDSETPEPVVFKIPKPSGGLDKHQQIPLSQTIQTNKKNIFSLSGNVNVIVRSLYHDELTKLRNEKDIEISQIMKENVQRMLENDKKNDERIIQIQKVYRNLQEELTSDNEELLYQKDQSIKKLKKNVVQLENKLVDCKERMKNLTLEKGKMETEYKNKIVKEKEYNEYLNNCQIQKKDEYNDLISRYQKVLVDLNMRKVAIKEMKEEMKKKILEMERILSVERDRRVVDEKEMLNMNNEHKKKVDEYEMRMRNVERKR